MNEKFSYLNIILVNGFTLARKYAQNISKLPNSLNGTYLEYGMG